MVLLAALVGVSGAVGAGSSTWSPPWIVLHPNLRAFLSTNPVPLVCASTEDTLRLFRHEAGACPNRKSWKPGTPVWVLKWARVPLLISSPIRHTIVTIRDGKGRRGAVLQSVLVPVIPRGTIIRLAHPCGQNCTSTTKAVTATVEAQTMDGNEPALSVRTSSGTRRTVDIYAVTDTKGCVLYVIRDPSDPASMYCPR